jgi:hypothetical protein
MKNDNDTSIFSTCEYYTTRDTAIVFGQPSDRPLTPIILRYTTIDFIPPLLVGLTIWT